MRIAWAVKFSISVIKLTLVLLHLHSAHHLPPHFHCNHSRFLLKKRINKHQRRMLLFKRWSWTLFLSIQPELQAKEGLEFKSDMYWEAERRQNIRVHNSKSSSDNDSGQPLYTYPPFPMTDCIAFAKLTYFHNLKQIRLNPQRNPTPTAPPAEGFFKKTDRT